MADYLPRSDPEFSVWLSNFVAYLTAHQAELGLSESILLTAGNARTNWESAYSAHTASQSAAIGARQVKDQARDHTESFVRTLVRNLQTSSNMNDSHRAGLGLNLPSTTSPPSGEPQTRPVAVVDTSQRLCHTISFNDETTPASKARPEGVMGCEIWVKVGGEPPQDPQELRFLALDTATPYMAKYGGADAGKIAHYMLRWVSKRQQQGPWSQTVSATITA